MKQITKKGQKIAALVIFALALTGVVTFSVQASKATDKKVKGNLVGFALLFSFPMLLSLFFGWAISVS